MVAVGVLNFSKRRVWTGQCHLHSSRPLSSKRGSLRLGQAQKLGSLSFTHLEFIFHGKCLKRELSLKDPNKLLSSGRNLVIPTSGSERGCAGAGWETRARPGPSCLDM